MCAFRSMIPRGIRYFVYHQGNLAAAAGATGCQSPCHPWAPFGGREQGWGHARRLRICRNFFFPPGVRLSRPRTSKVVGGYVREAGRWPGRLRGLGFLRRFALATSTGQAAWTSRPPVQCVSGGPGGWPYGARSLASRPRGPARPVCTVSCIRRGRRGPLYSLAATAR